MGNFMDVHVIFLYNKITRYSINSVLATIDRTENVRVHLVEDVTRLFNYVSTIRSLGGKCVVAISLLTPMLVNDNFYIELRDLVAKLRELSCIVVCGGPHATGDPLGTLKFFKFNYVFIGEAEESFREFILALRDGGDPSSVKGLAYIDDEGQFVFTGRREPVNLDKYDPFPYWRGIFSPIEITRGCPYGCFYCQVSYVHGFKYRHRGVEKIALYVEEFAKRGGKDIRFISPDGLAYGSTRSGKEINLGALETLLLSVKNVVEKRGGRIFLGTFPSEVRPEHVTSESLSLLKKYVFNKTIIIGAQSGSESVLKHINRQHSVEEAVNAVEVAIKEGFVPDVDLIIGFPGESTEDQLSTLLLAKKVVNLGGRVHLHYYIPLPGTPLGLKPPSPVPREIKKELSRIIGAGKGYGNIFSQEKLSQKIVELHEKGIIAPKVRS